MDNPWLLVIVAIIGSGAFGALVTEIFRSKNTAADALQKSAESLNLTYDQMMEAIKDASIIRREFSDLQSTQDLTVRELFKMKSIARKMYEILERRKIHTDLTREEVELIMRTKDLRETGNNKR
ncbi:MAG TPA: hypothetical protein VJ987_14320 [Anaerolineales bacterium]|nr:hypothetical protein [Anaerolineales bacterium]